MYVYFFEEIDECIYVSGYCILSEHIPLLDDILPDVESRVDTKCECRDICK